MAQWRSSWPRTRFVSALSMTALGGWGRPSATIASMPVPSRVEAAHQLLLLDPPPWFMRHTRAVAEIAAWLALRIERRGGHIDRRLVETAALLHDVDKLVPPSDPAARLGHGEGSAAWLVRHGYGELAAAAAWHPVTRLADDPAYETWWSAASPEERVVAYADKRAGQRLETMDARFASWRRRYPEIDDDPAGRPPAVGDGRRRGMGQGTAPGGLHTGGGWDTAVARRVRERAGALEAAVCRSAGVSPVEVRRLRWTDGALRAARLRTATLRPVQPHPDALRAAADARPRETHP